VAQRHQLLGSGLRSRPTTSHSVAAGMLTHPDAFVPVVGGATARSKVAKEIGRYGTLKLIRDIDDRLGILTAELEAAIGAEIPVRGLPA